MEGCREVLCSFHSHISFGIGEKAKEMEQNNRLTDQEFNKTFMQDETFLQPAKDTKREVVSHVAAVLGEVGKGQAAEAGLATGSQVARARRKIQHQHS